MKLSRRNFWLLAIALAAIILLTLIAAPQTNQQNSGSTYSRSPDGYGAWYAFMEKEGRPVKRWQKPFDELPGIKNKDEFSSPITMLEVDSQTREEGNYYFGALLADIERQWVEKGNTLVILGVRQPVTEATFSTVQESTFGGVKIETRRRKKLGKYEKERLSDRFGAIVWEEKLGKGRVIYATTPYLAANAYQDEPGNFKLLAKLVTEDGREVWVNEYIHGYKDKEVIAKEGKEDPIAYLAKTPLLLVVVQAGIILIVLFLANIRRFGQPISLTSPVVDNSEAYIQALAGVLRKAESNEFVLETIGKEEQMQLQKALGLGQTPLNAQTLVNAWVEQTGRKASELEQVLQLRSQKGRISEQELLNWLEKWQTIRR